MGEKSVQKKRYIVEKARDVFMEKGFKKVTMKDIVEACDISRGGLYLYFESTSQIFMEVLRMESEEADDVFSDSITEDATAADILLLFLFSNAFRAVRRAIIMSRLHTTMQITRANLLNISERCAFFTFFT